MRDLIKMAGVVQDYIARALQPVAERLKAIEDRQPERGHPGERGPQGEKGADGINGKDGAPGNPGERGPQGEKGVDGINGKDGALGQAGERGAQGEKGADGINGKDADPEQLKALVDRTVELMLPELMLRAIESATPDIIARAVALLPRPADGRDGRDGMPGLPGTPGEKGNDGINGRDGRDGLSLDDIGVTFEGRTLTLSLTAGERIVTRAVKLPALPDYKGVYKSQAYEAGDMVTYGGSMWLAKSDTTDPPPGQAWQLVVKGGK